MVAKLRHLAALENEYFTPCLLADKQWEQENQKGSRVDSYYSMSSRVNLSMSNEPFSSSVWLGSPSAMLSL